MNIQEITKILINHGIPVEEAKAETNILLNDLIGYTAEDKLRGRILTEDEISLLEEKVQERVTTDMPIQYIVGKAWFMGNLFKVTPDVLIPRDETEILVTEAIKIIKENNFENILDIGTGSGCIACTIAKRTNACVLGVDISSDALRVALDNVTLLGINNKAVFRKSDLFEKIREDESFDLIISNPPYVPEDFTISKEVSKEPKLALFGGVDGMDFYRKIIKQAGRYLNPNGYLMFELGINQSRDVKKYMEKEFSDIRIIKDLAGIDRVIIGKFK